MIGETMSHTWIETHDGRLYGVPFDKEIRVGIISNSNDGVWELQVSFGGVYFVLSRCATLGLANDAMAAFVRSLELGARVLRAKK